MKFKVMGSSRQTGGRAVMEVEATSRAAAERKAQAAGIDVLHVEQARDVSTSTDAAGADQPHASRRAAVEAERRGAGRIILMLLLVSLAAGAAGYWYIVRPMISQ